MTLTNASDRELLELAGQAYGLHVLVEGSPWPEQQVGWFFNQVGDNPPALYDRASPGVERWAPLDDDGDALRLANALFINIERVRSAHGKIVGVQATPSGYGHCGHLVSLSPKLTMDAATRRAIVLASAQYFLGKE